MLNGREITQPINQTTIRNLTPKHDIVISI